MNSPVLYIDTPYLSIDEYARRAGLSAEQVRSRIKKAMIPSIVLASEPGKRGAIMVNNALLIKEAMEQEGWRDE
ncbi:hypothetical protein [Alkalimarinus coralli]|uniref:hypothetical protein n=1 Tax=Alkalimarinus coralli TaxID=2935863 RepID=UPI00202AF33E|nr:hypothetical protein [Alkalimarinus coralli]